MGGKLEGIGSALEKFLAKAKAGGIAAVGKAGIESVHELARDNPRLAMILSGLAGAGGGYEGEKMMEPNEPDIRKDEDAEILRRYLSSHEGGM